MNRFWGILFLLVPILGVGTCIMAAYNVWPLEGCWFPENYSKQGETIDFLSNAAHVLCGVILLGTGLFLAWNLWNYSSRREGKATHIHHHRGLEITWSLIPASILIILSLYQYQSWEENRLQRPLTDVAGEQVETPPLAKVYAKRFGWEMHYAGPDGKLETADDLYMENLLVVPSHTDVVLQLESYDVIHSFFVPKLRLKHDIIPSRTQFTWFHATKEERADIYCAELCGWGHSLMRGQLIIKSPEEFAAWMEEQVISSRPSNQRLAEGASND